MVREIVVGNYCRRCEGLLNLHRMDCPCMRDMPEHATARWRKANWKPVFWRAEVTMEIANR